MTPNKWNDWCTAWVNFHKDKGASDALGNRLAYESVERIRKEERKKKK